MTGTISVLIHCVHYCSACRVFSDVAWKNVIVWSTSVHMAAGAQLHPELVIFARHVDTTSVWEWAWNQKVRWQSCYWLFLKSELLVIERYHCQGKYTYTWCRASLWIITSEALRYGRCSQGLSQFYLHTHTFSLQSEWEPYLPNLSYCTDTYTHSLVPDLEEDSVTSV